MDVPLLIAEPDPEARRVLLEQCTSLGYAARGAESAAETRRILEDHPIGVLIFATELDEQEPPSLLPESDGEVPVRVRIVPATRRRPPRSADLTRELEILRRPVHPDALARTLARIAARRTLQGERDELRDRRERQARIAITGRSGAASRLRDQVQRIADNPRSTVLVTGERGVEKELVARAIHSLSTRAAGPFRVLDCLAPAPPRFEAALLGSGRGEGRLAQTGSGTLLLREVTALGPDEQAALVPLLRDRRWKSATSGTDRALEARLIASTGGDLERLVEEGRFLEDLFYRLNVLTIRVPPLRDRIEDLPVLARSLLQEESGRSAPRPPELAVATLEALASYPWPGNLRELRLTLARAALLAPGATILPEHLALDLGALPGTLPGAPSPAEGADASLPATRSLRHLEEGLIRRVLEEQEGNRSRAARVLGIHRSTLYNKLRQYRIE